ncbi:MAG TPA: hypothetical protein VFH68_22400 [Polyangia bacterium]|jgi:hypothetical protein|nr:hypothetical protein [Polyangia bacterium]
MTAAAATARAGAGDALVLTAGERTNGNLVLCNWNGRALWNSHTKLHR